MNTRKQTEIYLIGHSDGYIPTNRLPTISQILKYCFYLKEDLPPKVKWAEVSSCPRYKEIQCINYCIKRKLQCPLRIVISIREKAGIPIETHKWKVEKILGYLEEWAKLKKNKNCRTDTQQYNEQEFVKKLHSTFDIASPYAKDKILKDTCRTEKDKQQGLEFLKIQLLERKGFMTDSDKVYVAAVDRKLQRLNARKSFEDREKIKCAQQFETISIPNEIEPCNLQAKPNDPDFKAPSTSQKKSTLVQAMIPRNILQLTASNAAATHTSPSTHCSIIANVAVESGVNLDDIVLSRSSARRAHIKSFRTGSAKVLNELLLKDFLPLHIDGKIMTDLTNQKVCTHEREAIAISSPDLDKPQLLDIPIIKFSSGINQFNAVSHALKQYNLQNKIISIASDTTSNMTGKNMGSVSRIERDLLKRAVLHILHVEDIFLKLWQSRLLQKYLDAILQVLLYLLLQSFLKTGMIL